MVMGFLLIGGELICMQLGREKTNKPTDVWRTNRFTKLTINET